MEAFTTTQVGALFSEGELQTLRRLLARLDTLSTTAPTTASTTFFAHKEIHANASTSTASLPWIIDSGATDHMTSCSSFFDSYSTCSGKDKVRVADGSSCSQFFY